MSIFYIKDERLDLINSMVQNNDINDLKSLKKWLNMALDDEMALNYYYDDLGDGYEYISSLEFDLTEINDIGYPIGYHIDLIESILLKNYTKDDLRDLNDMALLKLWHIHYFNSDYSHILALIRDEYFLRFKDDDMALKYLKISLESNISETNKIRLILNLIE